MKKHRQFGSIEKEEKKSKSGMFIAIFLAVVMMGGIGGIFLYKPGSTSQDSAFGRYTFRNVNNLWVTEVNDKDVGFYFRPNQVEFLDVSEPAMQLLKNSQGIILSFNPEQNSTSRLQALDIFRFEITDAILSEYRGKQMGFGISQKINTTINLPILTCDNSSFAAPVLFVDYYL